MFRKTIAIFYWSQSKISMCTDMMDIVNCTLTVFQKFLKFKHWQMSKSELIIKVRVQVDNLIERNVKKQRISTIQSHENLYLVFIKKYLIFIKRNYLVFMKTIIWFSWKQNDLVFIIIWFSWRWMLHAQGVDDSCTYSPRLPLPPCLWIIRLRACLNRQSLLPKCPATFSSLLFLLLLRDHEKYPMSNV